MEKAVGVAMAVQCATSATANASPTANAYRRRQRFVTAV